MNSNAKEDRNVPWDMASKTRMFSDALSDVPFRATGTYTSCFSLRHSYVYTSDAIGNFAFNYV